MPLTPWDWNEPNPVIADETKIRASHINNIRDAVDDTRSSVSQFTPHAEQHSVGGADQLTESIELDRYKYIGLEGAYMSANPAGGKKTYLSNNFYKTKSGLSRFSSGVNSGYMSISDYHIKFGYVPTHADVFNDKITFGLVNGDITTNGTITTTQLTVTGTMSIAGQIDGGSITGDLSINNCAITDDLSVGDDVTVAGTLYADTISSNNLTIYNSYGSVFFSNLESDYGVFKGININTSDTEDLYKQIISLNGIANTSQKLIIAPEIYTDSTRRDFQIMVTDSNYTNPLGELSIDSSKLKLQTFSSMSVNNLLIGNGSLGLGSLSEGRSIGDLTPNLDINGHILISDADTQNSYIYFNPSSSNNSFIRRIDGDNKLQIYGSTSDVNKCRTTEVWDQLIIQRNPVASNHDCHSSMWIISGDPKTFGSILHGIQNDGMLCLGGIFDGDYTTVLDNRGIQARKRSITSPNDYRSSDLYLQPQGGNVLIATESYGGELQVDGNIRVLNGSDIWLHGGGWVKWDGGAYIKEAYGELYIVVGSTTYNFTSSGNIVIGTTSGG